MARPRRSLRPGNGRAAAGRCGAAREAGTASLADGRGRPRGGDAAGVRRGDGVGRIGHRARQAGHRDRRRGAEPDPAPATPAPSPGREGQDSATGDDGGAENDPTQWRVPRRGAIEQHPGPARRRRDGDRRHDSGPDPTTRHPQLVAPYGDEGGDGRRQSHGVVRMDDALAVAEDRSGDQQPTAPDDGGRPHPIGARGVAPDHQHGHHGDQGRRKQPGGLPPHEIVEEAEDPGRPTEVRATPGARSREAPEAVVVEDQIQDAVVG